ncbi:hypothetical protein D1AOALGA4SA_10003 [Olavius algarvensis Delta 1 endosymbiont]|nr:hypothetical protein D1AOALGA4SA_10003 [Olavius algarvensis Delta 1 endosymbiont]
MVQKTDPSHSILTPETRHLKPFLVSMPHLPGGYQWKK